MHPKIRKCRRGSRQRGSALILVLWCLLLLGMAIFGVVEVLELSVEHSSHDAIAVEARALALSGVALGMNPQLFKNDPLLFQKFAAGRQFKVTVSSEGSRLNLNYVLLSNHREILENLFTQWGLGVTDADTVADCLYDWVTPGDLPSVDGAKADAYARAGLPQRPSHQPFVSLDEVREVMNIGLLDKVKPDWQESFTLWSGGPLNVNEAPPELIAAVFSLDPKQVAFFTNVRNGQDGIAGTPDDVTVPDMNTLAAKLGIGSLAMQNLGSQVSFNDSTRRVESVGQVEGTQVMILVVTQANSSPLQYFVWSEQ